MLERYTFILGIVLSIVALFSIFGFNISPAITEDKYKLDHYKVKSDIDNISQRIKSIYCYTLHTRVMYLRLERIKYSSYQEVNIESDSYGTMATYHKAKASLENITNHLKDTETLMKKEGC